MALSQSIEEVIEEACRDRSIALFVECCQFKQGNKYQTNDETLIKQTPSLLSCWLHFTQPMVLTEYLSFFGLYSLFSSIPLYPVSYTNFYFHSNDLSSTSIVFIQRSAALRTIPSCQHLGDNFPLWFFSCFSQSSVAPISFSLFIFKDYSLSIVEQQKHSLLCNFPGSFRKISPSLNMTRVCREKPAEKPVTSKHSGSEQGRAGSW